MGKQVIMGKNTATYDRGGVDPEMQKTLDNMSGPGGSSRLNDSDYLDRQWKRVNTSRANRGVPAIPKPGSKAYRE